MKLTNLTSVARCLGLGALSMALLAPAVAAAANDEPAPSTASASDDDDELSFMKLLANHGAHSLQYESWNAYGQFTYISSWKRPFSAAYTDLNGSGNSLSPDAERSYTATLTFYLGLRLWPGAEAYLVPEVVSEHALSELAGLGASIQNFELQKQGSSAPTLYRSRAYLTQTINLGGAPVTRDSAPVQLGSVVDSRRLLLAFGNFSILDFFDRNSVVGDPRRGFFNIAFMTHGAYDFAADARGYAWGGVLELHYDDWAVRFARITPPKDPNQLELDYRFYKYYGDQLELEHAHRVFGRPGAVRLLGYRNRENMGSFEGAVASFQAHPEQNAAACTQFNYGSANSQAPDLCWVRKPSVKIGLGIAFEQRITDDIGMFARAMVSDGRTEVYSYTSSDRSASLGAVVHGAPWHRPADTVGVGYAASWISSAHAQYLKLGGIDGFIGDGNLSVASERVIEAYYSFDVYSSLWLSADFQHISNPAYNADRGPVNVFGARGHAEF